MFNQLYETIKKTMKENLGFLITFFLLLILFTFEFPYYIDTPGGIINIDSRITIHDAYEPTGSFNMAYVTERKATIPTLLMAQFKKDWDIIPKSEVVASNESVKDANFRDQLMLQAANQAAIQVAFQKAGKPFSVTDQAAYVTYVTEEAKTTLQVQDQILMVEETEFLNQETLSNLIQEKKVGETIHFTVLRQKKNVQAEATIIEEEGRKLIGILITKDQKLITDPEIEFHFQSSESGPSGGLMMSLAIYNYLIPEDLTLGKRIVGTGTISEDGRVGSIDGVKYKLKGAVKAKADLFFVPAGENYEEALAIAKKQGYTIPIIPVETFDDAIHYLKNAD